MSYVMIQKKDIEDCRIAVGQKWFDPKLSSDDYVVGFFLPDGSFFVDLVEAQWEDACIYCHFMNGGSRNDMPL